MAAPMALYVTVLAISLRHQRKRDKEAAEKDGNKGGHA
jgi:hypothetical protein